MKRISLKSVFVFFTLIAAGTTSYKSLQGDAVYLNKPLTISNIESLTSTENGSGEGYWWYNPILGEWFWVEYSE
ncbi:MAG: hypothetical protein R3Y26_06680 [Rikenellaceae bacterium]